MSILRELLDATPQPPQDADIDTLTSQFAVISAQRHALIESIITSGTPARAVTTPDDRAVLDELRAREAAWMDALGTALDHVRAQRIGTAKLKGYAAGVG